MKISSTKHPGAKAFDSLKAAIQQRPALFVCLSLAALVWAVFGPTLGHEFINYDDDLYVYDNPAVIRGLNLAGVGWAFTHIVASNWHPVTMMSHMLDVQIYGLNAGGHHLTNVLLHTMTVILLFIVLREMTGALWRSALVAAVFAIHPLRVESVAWVAERKDVLSGVFFMLTLWAYTRYARSKFSLGRYLLVMFLFALGLMSKPMLVTLPFVLLLLDYWPLRRFENTNNLPELFTIPRHLLLEKIPLLALTVVSCVATVASQNESIVRDVHLPAHVRIENAGLSYVTYMAQLFYPANLALMHPHPIGGIPIWKSILALVLLTLISCGVLALRRKRPYMIVGWLLYLGMLVPVIGIVQVGLQAHADRYTYLPQIGLCILLTWTLAELFVSTRPGILLGGLAAAIIVTLAICARVQISYWRDSESIWRHTLAVTSRNIVPHYNMGVALFNKGRMDEAIVHYQKGLEIYPDNPLVLKHLGVAILQKGDADQAILCFQKSLAIIPDDPETLDNMARALLKKNQSDEAIIYIQKAIAIKPDAETFNDLGNIFSQKGRMDEAIAHYQKALELAPAEQKFQSDLANALYRTGRLDDAIALYEKSLAAKPDNANAESGLGLALFEKRRVDEAIVHWQKSLAIKPDDAKVQNNLGNALMLKRRTAEAVAHYQKALELQPNYPEAQCSLAWVLATSGQPSLRDGGRAVVLAENASQLTGGNNPTVLRILAAAYAEAGKFEQAVQTGKQALELMSSQASASQTNALLNEINLYLRQTPFHDTPRSIQP